MNWKSSLDRYLTAGPPENPIDSWFECLGDTFSDEWFDKHGDEFLEQDSKIDKIAVRLYKKDRTPEQAAKTLERIFK